MNELYQTGATCEAAFLWSGLNKKGACKKVYVLISTFAGNMVSVLLAGAWQPSSRGGAGSREEKRKKIKKQRNL